jgi:hypothetical protein
VSDWVADGRFVDAIIGFTLLETLGLLVYHRLSGRGPAPGSILPTLASGLCLMLAPSLFSCGTHGLRRLAWQQWPLRR